MPWLARFFPLLANADPGESSDSMLLLVLIALALLVAAAILAAVPILHARRQGGRKAQAIVPICVVWGFVVAGLGLNLVFSYARWSHENSVLMLSGYYEASTAPVFSWHWPWWGALAAMYAALVVAAFVRRRF